MRKLLWLTTLGLLTLELGMWTEVVVPFGVWGMFILGAFTSALLVSLVVCGVRVQRQIQNTSFSSYQDEHIPGHGQSPFVLPPQPPLIILPPSGMPSRNFVHPRASYHDQNGPIKLDKWEL